MDRQDVKLQHMQDKENTIAPDSAGKFLVKNNLAEQSAWARKQLGLISQKSNAFKTVNCEYSRLGNFPFQFKAPFHAQTSESEREAAVTYLGEEAANELFSIRAKYKLSEAIETQKLRLEDLLCCTKEPRLENKTQRDDPKEHDQSFVHGLHPWWELPEKYPHPKLHEFQRLGNNSEHDNKQSVPVKNMLCQKPHQGQPNDENMNKITNTSDDKLFEGSKLHTRRSAMKKSQVLLLTENFPGTGGVVLAKSGHGFRQLVQELKQILECQISLFNPNIRILVVTKTSKHRKALKQQCYQHLRKLFPQNSIDECTLGRTRQNSQALTLFPSNVIIFSLEDLERNDDTFLQFLEFLSQSKIKQNDAHNLKNSQHEEIQEPNGPKQKYFDSAYNNQSSFTTCLLMRTKVWNKAKELVPNIEKGPLQISEFTLVVVWEMPPKEKQTSVCQKPSKSFVESRVKKIADHIQEKPLVFEKRPAVKSLVHMNQPTTVDKSDNLPTLAMQTNFNDMHSQVQGSTKNSFKMKRTIHRSRWTREQDEALLAGMQAYPRKANGRYQWAPIKRDKRWAGILASRTNVDLQNRWQNLKKKIAVEIQT